MEVLGFLINDKCDSNLWNLVKASREGPAFSHLFIANDLMLFAKADLKNCHNVKEVLDTFSMLSGQKVGPTKSKVYFSQMSLKTSNFLFVIFWVSTPPLI